MSELCPRPRRKTLNLLLPAIAVTLLVTPLAGAATNPHRPARLLAPAPVGEQATAPNVEPIAYIGHGGFFDQSGRQIVPTAEFVARAQSWYREHLLAGLSARKRADFAAFEARIGKDLNLAGQGGLVVRQRALDWLTANSPRTVATGRIQAKLNALKFRLNWRLPAGNDLKLLTNLVPFQLDTRIKARLQMPEFNPGGMKTATTNSGAAYTAECTAADVPIPPSIGVLDPLGTSGWRSLGFIPTSEQFIVGTPAEVRVFEASNGMCIALPRYTSGTLATVMLDGVICLSSTTSKVCFWDNQMSGNGFTFSSGTQIPIGAPDLSVNSAGKYQAGGAEIEFGDGGVCTDCHAGENPYIIHPDSDLGGGTFMGDLNSVPLSLPTFGPNRYDPLVGASWPQNALSHAQALVPSACSGCHTLGGSGGRFPHLSSDIPSYCNTVLALAIANTMPLGSPGSQAGTAAITTFQNWCSSAPSAGPSNRGDPHLTTTNGINYDFQAAGEFTSLRNSSNGFELQTRQTPVLTTFTPGANAYTGLASCVSLNTAAALRVNGHRISYQPAPNTPGRDTDMQLRIDGKLTTLPSAGSLSLGGNNRISTTASGTGIDVRTDDGTRVIVTPNYWSSQGYWYLNVEVLSTPAREGTMGHIVGTDFLPLSPTGASFGPKPAPLAARHTMLNGTFANAWRVTAGTSLFDYAPGTSTASFTNTSWPPPPGAACTSIPSGGFPWPGVETRLPVRPMDQQVAERLCSFITDKPTFDNCVFDAVATGNSGIADAYRLTLTMRATP